MTQLEIPWFRPRQTMQQPPASSPGTSYDLSSLDLPLANGMRLMQHQKEAVPRLLERSMILADVRGLGKTIESLAAAKILWERYKWQVIVICPANKIEDWRAEAKLVGVPINAYSWAKQPTEEMVQFHDYILIADEAHYAQGNSQRTKRFLELSECAEMVWCLTGTPMKNARPSNIFNLLRAINHPLGKNRKVYEERFCGASMQKRPFGKPKVSCGACRGSGKSRGKVCHCRMVRFWDVSGATHTDQLKLEIAPWVLRRTKEQCLDLPPLTRILEDVEITAEANATYERIIAEAKTRYQAKLSTGEIVSWLSEGQRTGQGEAMSILMGIRRAASVAKVPSVIELVEDILEQGDKAIVFTMFRESASLVAKHFNVRPFIAGESDQSIIQRFQTGPDKVFSGTMQSGGTGLNLQSGSYVIALDRPYTPGDIDQAEGRADRLGQKKSVTSLWIRGFEIDHTIDDLLLKKEQIIAAVLEGSDEAIRGGGAITATQVLANLFR